MVKISRGIHFGLLASALLGAGCNALVGLGEPTVSDAGTAGTGSGTTGGTGTTGASTGSGTTGGTGTTGASTGTGTTGAGAGFREELPGPGLAAGQGRAKPVKVAPP